MRIYKRRDYFFLMEIKTIKCRGCREAGIERRTVERKKEETREIFQAH